MSHRTAYNVKPSEGQIFTDPSLTIPGQSLSLRELLERYVISGTTETFKGTYTGEEETEIPDNIEKMDRMEKLDLARDLRHSIADAQQQLAFQQKEAAKASQKSKDSNTPTNPPTVHSPDTE